jgi:hypothetical protein
MIVYTILKAILYIITIFTALKFKNKEWLLLLIHLFILGLLLGLYQFDTSVIKTSLLTAMTMSIALILCIHYDLFTIKAQMHYGFPLWLIATWGIVAVFVLDVFGLTKA